jgi:hypothetical protein
MTMVDVHIYDIPQVITVSTGSGAQNMNYPVNSTDIRLFKYVRNTIRIFVKDIDRKPVTLSDPNIPMIVVTDRRNQKVLLNRSMDTVDQAKGLYQIVIDPVDLDPIDIGYYNYFVLTDSADGTPSPLYTDRNRSPLGVIEVAEGPVPLPRPSIEIAADQFSISNTVAISGAYAGSATVGDLSGLHSVAFYLDNFQGNITVQGSLDAQPTSTDSYWFEVHNYSFDDDTYSGVYPRSFEGNLVWVRFIVSQTDGQFTGLTKILYRN